MTIVDKPGKPGRPEATDIKVQTVALKWKVPDDDGGAPIKNYVVEYRIENSIQWVPASSKDTVPDPNYKVRKPSSTFQ